MHVVNRSVVIALAVAGVAACGKKSSSSSPDPNTPTAVTPGSGGARASGAGSASAATDAGSASAATDGGTASAATDAGVAAAATDAGAPAAVTAVTEGVLEKLENGDRACYVTARTIHGEETHEGDFELCKGGKQDASRLVGKHVVWTTEKAQVQAAACQGDPDCTKTDDVELIDKLALSTAPTLDALAAGLDAAAVEKAFGAPAQRSAPQQAAADGTWYTDWTWPASDLEIVLGADAEKGAYKVASVTCNAACTLTTDKGIGIGATAAQVKQAYRKAAPQDGQPDTLLVGSPLGGTFFRMDKGVVSSIFVGPNGE